jgi:hypothetical protein
MRFIEEEQRVKARFSRLFTQGRAVAIHRKHGFRHDDDSRIRLFPSRPFQVALQFTEVIMRKDANAGAAQACAIDQRSVSQFIENDDVVFPGDEGRVPTAAA